MSVQNSEQNTTTFLQIGQCELPISWIEKNKCVVIGNNEPINITRLYSDISSTEPIKDIYMRSRGDIYNPTELLENTSIGSSIYAGHDGKQYVVTSTIECMTTEDFTTTSHGSALMFGTTHNGTTEPKINLVIDHDGSILCKGTNNSISTSTGSLIVDGGASIAKNLNIGGATYHACNIYFDSLTNVSSLLNYTEQLFDKKIINICGGGDATTTRGSKIIVSGVDSILDGKVSINAGVPNGTIELFTGNKERFIISKSGNCRITNDDDAVSALSGSLILEGGLNVHKNIYIGGSKIILDSANKPMIRPSTNVLQDNSSLSLCGGGDNDTERGGCLNLLGNCQNGGGSISLVAGNVKSGCIKFSTGESSEMNCVVDSNGVWNFQKNINATSVITGAVVINGGLGVNQTLMSNTIKCTDVLQIPCLSTHSADVIGSIYYDTKANKIKVYTSQGWKFLMFG